ncbi:hypothetical protein [Aliarcobacter butzleri]|uniref:hypothetical protein n=1 Tax=Aliarcobacter butzleri TaxID=28197 RepID=UPI00125F5C2C|nr:hypothetical protein [Aliarcobacter butzleri]
MKKNLLDECFIKQGTFKPMVLGGKKEIIIRELTIAETQEFVKKNQEDSEDAILYAVKCSMVEPSFFTEDELKKINATGYALIREIFAELPVIGKTKEEREEHFSRVRKIIEEQQQTDSKTEENEEKK